MYFFFHEENAPDVQEPYKSFFFAFLFEFGENKNKQILYDQNINKVLS